ncbi:hypothetical protein CRUP_021544 [Coryphaenoides rupestris]|nr:hypothetical protein CRUP_021544 [Coryphaenoides rupestris]
MASAPTRKRRTRNLQISDDVFGESGDDSSDDNPFYSTSGDSNSDSNYGVAAEAGEEHQRALQGGDAGGDGGGGGGDGGGGGGGAGPPGSVSRSQAERDGWTETLQDVTMPPYKDTYGPAQKMPVDSTALDFFQLFVPDNCIQNMVTQTNMYAKKFQERFGSEEGWRPVTAQEMKAFLGFVVSTSVHRCESVLSIWSAGFFSNRSIALKMSQARFEKILKYFHIVAFRPSQGCNQGLYKIPALPGLTAQQSFSHTFRPSQTQVLHEPLIDEDPVFITTYIYCCGLLSTRKSDCTGLPQCMLVSGSTAVQRGQSQVMMQGSMSLISWYNKGHFRFLTNAYSPTKQGPQDLRDSYNPNKTWQQVFWLTISIAINNAYILYKMSDAYAAKRYSRAAFGERLVKELLELDDCSPTQ